MTLDFGVRLLRMTSVDDGEDFRSRTRRLGNALAGQMPEVPDSVSQHDHTDLEKKGRAETAGAPESVGFQLDLLFLGCS
jgi:hypothetical protein